MTLATFIQASAHQLDSIADGSVQAIVTSPPYYGLRAYAGEQAIEWPAVEYAPMPGLPPIRIAGCERGCEHEWTDIPPQYQQGKAGDNSTLHGAQSGGRVQSLTQGAYCSKCGGWRGGLGNEPTLEAYIGHLVLCLREWRRVLRADGCCFVNLGDSYASAYAVNRRNIIGNGSLSETERALRHNRLNGLKEKDLMMVPARFALAAQADGWWLRSDIIGYKIAPMPESVTDRPTRSHEHIFMLTKQSRYYWDAEGVKEQAVKGAAGSTFTNGKTGVNGMGRVSQLPRVDDSTSRNMRDVIEWRPSPFSGAHFATFPEAIPEKLIRAATSERGACPHCGAPWARVVKREFVPQQDVKDPAKLAKGSNKGMDASNGWGDVPRGTISATTLGFAPSCTCPPHEPVPCIVLDPFSGSGTTAKVAVRLGRRAIGVDISAEYLDEVTALRFGDGVQMELTGL